MIEFFCPNEHKIRCSEEMAGRPAKCPKCGVSFRVPNLEELNLEASAINDAAEEETADAAAAMPPPDNGHLAAAKEQQIEFLCPNGHHLHGPASLQGRAGECPECGSRFRIPVIDEPEESPKSSAELEAAEPAEAVAEEEITLDSHQRSEKTSGTASEPIEFLPVLDVPGAAAASRSAIPGEIPGFSSLTGNGPTGLHPLAALFAELWAARDAGSRVEVHLESGSIIVPDGYVRSHSLHDYAVLATKDPDGRWTTTVVPWSTITKIILRALKELPGEVVR